MPSGLSDEEDGVGPWCDCLGDFGQMQVHRFGVAGREDQSRALSLLRADGSEDVGRGGALIPRSAWASTALGPPAGDLVLLTNARFIREPNLYFPNIDCLFARDFIQARWELYGNGPPLPTGEIVSSEIQTEERSHRDQILFELALALWNDDAAFQQDCAQLLALSA